MLAILGRGRRSGRLNLSPRSSALALFGTCHLDMRHATVDGDTFKMKVTVLFGAATLILPEGATVKPSGSSLAATARVDVPEKDQEASLPTLEIEWVAAFGKLLVLDTVQYEALSAEDPGPPPPTAADRIETPPVISHESLSAAPLFAERDHDEPVLPELIEPIVAISAALPAQEIGISTTTTGGAVETVQDGSDLEEGVDWVGRSTQPDHGQAEADRSSEKEIGKV